jgi:hypothetical protein
MKHLLLALIIGCGVAGQSAFANDLQHNMPSRAQRGFGMDRDLIFAGENSDFKLHFDKNITTDNRRQQGTVYVLVEAKKPRDYTTQNSDGVLKVQRWRYMVQRTDIDCGRHIYISDFVTYFNADTGAIIQETTDGTPYKVNDGSLMGIVYRHVCGSM